MKAKLISLRIPLSPSQKALAERIVSVITTRYDDLPKEELHSLIEDEVAKYKLEEMRSKFFRRVKKTESCWLWEGSISELGYGRFSVGRRTCFAHRVAMLLHGHTIPDGLEIDHLCRVRNCVNPIHMELVTREENLRRRSYAFVDRCPRGHLYEGDNLYLDASSGGRRCRMCLRDQRIARRTRK